MHGQNHIKFICVTFPTFLITAVLADYNVLSQLFHIRHKIL